MRKLFLLLCFIITLLVCGCKSDQSIAIEETTPTSKETEKEAEETVDEDSAENQGTSETITNIDWTDFIKYFDRDYENSGMVVPEGIIDIEVGEVTGNPPFQIEGTEYVTKNGEAGWLPVGTKLYSVKELDQFNYITAYFEGQYIFYKTIDSPDVKLQDTQGKKAPKKVTKKDRISLTEAAGYTSIYKLPQEYSISMAGDNGDYVSLYDSTMNADKMIDFLTDVGNKKAAMIRKVTMTIEGDIIINDYIYNGESFRAVMDGTRDKFAENSKRVEKNFDYVSIKEEENGKYIILTNGEPEEENKEDIVEEIVFLSEREMEELDGIHLLKLNIK